jgi:hypothetical protein
MKKILVIFSGIILAIILLKAYGSHLPDKEKSIFSKTCEIAKSGKGDDRIIGFLSYFKEACWLTYIDSEGRPSTKGFTTYCSKFDKEKLIVVTDFTHNGGVRNIELINNDGCELVKFMGGGTVDPQIFLYPGRFAKNLFQRLSVKTSILRLKELGFRILEKNGNVWKLHTHPATSVFVKINDNGCSTEPNCEDKAFVEEFISEAEEYVIEDDNGNIVSIKKRAD